MKLKLTRKRTSFVAQIISLSNKHALIKFQNEKININQFNSIIHFPPWKTLMNSHMECKGKKYCQYHSKKVPVERET